MVHRIVNFTVLGIVLGIYSMIIMLCGACQGDMYIYNTKYYAVGSSQYYMIYQLKCENNHYAEIKTGTLNYNPDQAEARVIRHLIEYTQTLERTSNDKSSSN